MKVRSIAYVLGVVLVAGGSFYLGGMRRGEARAPAGDAALALPAAPASPPIYVNAHATIDQAALEAVIRDTVRAELARRDPGVERETPVDPAVSAAAEKNGRVIVERAIASRRWTEKDHASFRAELAKSSPEGQLALVSELLPAINHDEVRVEIAGPLAFF